jgi:hypothetical protein
MYLSIYQFIDFLSTYVGVLISLWVLLFAAQPKDFFWGVGKKKLEKRGHTCMELTGGICRVNAFLDPLFFIKPKIYEPPSYLSTAGQPYVGPWPLFQFLNAIHSR